MRKKVITILGIFIFALFLLSSCQTKEERLLKKFESLAERIDKESETFSEKDWEEVLAEYKALHDEARDCDFTNEQLREFGRVEGLLTVAIAREGSKKLGSKLGRFVNEGKQVVEGFVEGFREGLIKEEAENPKRVGK